MDNRILAVYDLFSYAPTFNIYEFLTSARIYADEKKALIIDLLIIRRNLLESEITQPQSIGEYNFRINDILLNSTQMFPLKNIYNLKSNSSNIIKLFDEYNNIFPETYKYDLDSFKLRKDRYFLQPFIKNYFLKGNSIPSIAPPLFAHKLIKNNLTDSINNLVTITIRNAKHLTNKNSNIHEWLKVKNYFVKNGFKVIILPDIESLNDTENIDTLGVMSTTNQAYRTSLYDSAFLNLGVNNGAIAPLFFNANARMLIAKTYTENTNTSLTTFENLSGINTLNGSWTKVPWHTFIFNHNENADEIITNSLNLIDNTDRVKNDLTFAEIIHPLYLDPWGKLDGTIINIDNNQNIYPNNYNSLICNLLQDKRFFRSAKSLLINALSDLLKNNFEAALIYAKQSILLDGRWADPYLICAHVYSKLNKPNHANIYFKTAAGLNTIFFTYENNEYNLNLNNDTRDILLV